MPITAMAYVEDSRFTPLVTNTSIGLIFSMQQGQLEPLSYYSPEELDRHFSLTYSMQNTSPVRQKNVVVLVLESFGKAQIGYYQKNSRKSNTPFLDSLIQHCFQCPASFANGLRSTQGIVATLAGIPALMEDPLMFSAYQGNHLQGFGHLLGALGYTTGFFHGSNPGSMEFGRFAKSAGFDYAFDRTHYPDQSHYDGSWGIWDMPYFQYMLSTIDTFPQPFGAVLFSLSSHHPYQVESWFEAQYPKLDPISRSYRYTDEALRRFFEQAAQEDWFANTLFVITADHCGPSQSKRSLNPVERYSIPLLWYDPSQSIEGPTDCIAQQKDILPSILDYIGYNGIIKSFGRSPF